MSGSPDDVAAGPGDSAGAASSAPAAAGGGGRDAAPAAPAPSLAPATGGAASASETQPADRGVSPGPVVEAPSSDVELAEDASPLPGVHRGGFSRLPTAPIGVTMQVAPEEELDVRWAEPAPAPTRGLAAWALTFAILGLVVSLFVGWGFPLGIAAIVAAILALRRPLESRAVAIWALALAVVSILYSALWLVWAATRANIFG